MFKRWGFLAVIISVFVLLFALKMAAFDDFDLPPPPGADMGFGADSDLPPPPPMGDDFDGGLPPPPGADMGLGMDSDLPPPPMGDIFGGDDLPPPPMGDDFGGDDLPPPPMDNDFGGDDLPPPPGDFDDEEEFAAPPPPARQEVVETKPEPVREETVTRIPSGKIGNYTVVRGDSLWKISGKRNVYGNSFQWPLLFRSNKDKIEDPDLIYPRQNFEIKHTFTAAEIRDAVQKAKETPPYVPHTLPRKQLPIKY